MNRKDIIELIATTTSDDHKARLIEAFEKGVYRWAAVTIVGEREVMTDLGVCLDYHGAANVAKAFAIPHDYVTEAEFVGFNEDSAIYDRYGHLGWEFCADEYNKWQAILADRAKAHAHV